MGYSLMPPVPKPPEMRQRRNKTSTRATLYVLEGAKKNTAPELPEGDWHELTQLWWKNVWSSPMAGEYLESDRHGLILLAHLIEQYWRDPKTTIAAEIRMQEQRFGLSPIDRRRLQWEVKKVEGEGRGRGGRGRPVPERSKDPRSILRPTAS